MVDAIVFTQNKVSKIAGGPTKIENPKIGLIGKAHISACTLPLTGSHGRKKKTILAIIFFYTSKLLSAGCLRGGVYGQYKSRNVLIQFCISYPKKDMDLTLKIQEYSQMDRVLKEERVYIVKLIKKIKATGCNVLLTL